MVKKVERSRNLGTETESEHMGKIRSALRRLSRFWKPALQSLELAKFPYKGKNSRQKWEYKCEGCANFYIRKDVQINHKVPCGTFTCYEDAAAFLRRLFCEDVEGYNILCKECHLKETATQKKGK